MTTWRTRGWPRPSSWPCASHRPLFLEGEAGVGKTEVAKVLAGGPAGALIRLQCYEGIDVAQAVYEWDYARQLLHLRTAEATGRCQRPRGPRGRAVRRAVPAAPAPAGGHQPHRGPPRAPDRRDRPGRRRVRGVPAGGPSDYRSPSLSWARSHAATPPIVILTSNRTRDVHDALKRRCLYHWVEHPGFEREVAIVRLRAPGSASAWPARWRRPSRPCGATAVQAAGRGRDDRLGPVAGRAGPHRAGRGHRGGHVGYGARSTAKTQERVTQQGVDELIRAAVGARSGLTVEVRSAVEPGRAGRLRRIHRRRF